MRKNATKRHLSDWLLMDQRYTLTPQPCRDALDLLASLDRAVEAEGYLLLSPGCAVHRAIQSVLNREATMREQV